MYPELFRIPFTPLTVKSYGLMMVVAFLAAVFLIRYLSRNIIGERQFITNASLYCLIGGVLGARLFYVVHHFDEFQGHPLSVFAVWQGGLEFLGGVVLAIVVVIFYLRWRRLGIGLYFDILAIGLMLGLAFGRIGCFLIGDCFGMPAELPWAVRFPYDSLVYRSQVYPNPERSRHQAQLELPAEFLGYYDENGTWVRDLKPYEYLTQEQKEMVDKGPYRCLPVHPTQLYSSANALFLCLILYLFWRRSIKAGDSANSRKFGAKPGSTFALMFILYGISRFFIETVRDDNPFEYGWWAIYKGGTVSQNLGICLVISGVALMIIFQKIKPKAVELDESKKT